jgi:sulfite reductase alpha subunit-like flavoprotein
MLFVLDCYCTPPPSFHLEFLKDTTLNGVEHSNGVEQIKHEGTFDAIVTKNERITTADHFQDVRHIELKIQTDNHSNYKTKEFAKRGRCVFRIYGLVGPLRRAVDCSS